MGIFANWLALKEDTMVSSTGLAGPEDNGLARPQNYQPVKKVSKFANKLFGVDSTKSKKGIHHNEKNHIR